MERIIPFIVGFGSWEENGNRRREDRRGRNAKALQTSSRCLGLQPSSSVIPVSFIFLPFPHLWSPPPLQCFISCQSRSDASPRNFSVCLCLLCECRVRFCVPFLPTDHVHGVLALGQRGQLGLGVVQAHSLPQGPKVTWVALLSTQTNTQRQ